MLETKWVCDDFGHVCLFNISVGQNHFEDFINIEIQSPTSINHHQLQVANIKMSPTSLSPYFKIPYFWLSHKSFMKTRLSRVARIIGIVIKIEHNQILNRKCRRNSVRNWSKMGPKWVQMGPKWIKNVPKWILTWSNDWSLIAGPKMGHENGSNEKSANENRFQKMGPNYGSGQGSTDHLRPPGPNLLDFW